MRFILPTAAIAAALTVSPSIALASQPPRHHNARIASHVSLHIQRHSILSGKRTFVTGRVSPRGRQRVKLVIRGAHHRLIGVTTKPGGAFAIHWGPDRVGAYSLRGYVIHDRRIRGSASPARRLTAYRVAVASYYGPGLYGNGTACGGSLQPATLGVAHKTLPCGSKVTLRYHGRSVAVRVIDRGPYVAGRDFDLTEATRNRLHFPGVGVLLWSR
jgi:peptidoglycan lytic transglycosylase